MLKVADAPRDILTFGCLPAYFKQFDIEPSDAEKQSYYHNLKHGQVFLSPHTGHYMMRVELSNHSKKIFTIVAVDTAGSAPTGVQVFSNALKVRKENQAQYFRFYNSAERRADNSAIVEVDGGLFMARRPLIVGDAPPNRYENTYGRDVQKE